MPWTKLKNIILIILVITNLALLGLVAGPAVRNRRVVSRARADAILLLRSRGVQVEENIVPETVALPPRTVERDLTVEERAAAALLDGPVSVEARGGEVYRYFNENGYLQFHSDGTVRPAEGGAVPSGGGRGGRLRGPDGKTGRSWEHCGRNEWGADLSSGVGGLAPVHPTGDPGVSGRLPVRHCYRAAAGGPAPGGFQPNDHIGGHRSH